MGGRDRADLLRRGFHLEIGRFLDDLPLSARLSALLTLFLAALAILLIILPVVRSHAHPAHVPVKPQRLVRIRVVVRAEEGLADDLVHFVRFAMFGRSLCQFLRLAQSLVLLRTRDAGFKTSIFVH